MLRTALLLITGHILSCTAADAGDVFAHARKEISPPKDFQVAVRSITLHRDAEIDRSLCTVILGVSWDKRLSPLLIQQGAVSATFAKDAAGKSHTAGTSPQGPVQVVGRGSAELRFQVSAPPRSSPRIDVLKGQFIVTTPSKMLDFAFDSLKIDRPTQKTIQGVSVTVEKVAAGPDRLSVELSIDNPKGTPSFETFQTSVWIENNRLILKSHKANAVRLLSPEANDEELLEPLTPLRARMRYHLKVDRKTLGSLEDWQLFYQTPGPIVEVAMPFELKNIALP